MEDHTGTHVDAPFHLYVGEHRVPRGRTIAELALDKLMARRCLAAEYGSLDSPGHPLLFPALPLEIEGATGSPVRPVAIVEE